MSVLIFFIILSALVIVHELGHFLVAKWSGIRVDEFGLGFPPRAKKIFTWKGTPFTLNWLPFGGFVKIFGENPEEPPRSDLKPDSQGPTLAADSFQSKNRGIQAAVLAAGVFFNFVFAWLLISIGFMIGLPSPAGLGFPVEDQKTVVTIVLPGSPAAEAGLRSGDRIMSVSRGDDILADADDDPLTPEEISGFIALSFEPMTFVVERGDNAHELAITPEGGIIADRPAVGISMDMIGTAKLGLFGSFRHGLKMTSELTYRTAEAIGSLIVQAFAGKASLSAVTGPVGIVGMVGDVRELGFSYLLTFTALISINLAIVNLLPIPALDGGRLVFVAVEAIARRKVPAKFFNIVNTAGFALLIILMLAITARDVMNLF